MGEADETENSGDSDTTEGEQEENTEGEETPVIDEENNSEEDQENDSAENQEQEEKTSGEDLETAVMGEEVTPMANEDGTFTVHLPSDSATVTVAGDTATTAGQDYTFTVTPKEGYENPTAKAYTGTDNTGAEVTVEELAEAEGIYTFTITKETLSAIAAEVTDITIEAEATAIKQKRLYPSIDNDQKDKWTLTPVEGLSADGKTYLTVSTIDGSWDGFVDDEGKVYSEDGIAANEIEGKVLAFGVDLKGGYRFASDNPDAQVKAALLGQNWSDGSKVTLTEVAAAYTNEHYEIDLGTLGAADWFEGYDGLELIVWADVEPLSQYSLYISRDTGISAVEVSTDAENWTSQPNPWAGDYTENSDVYIRITPKTGYTYTVRKFGSEQAAEKVAGRDYYQFTMPTGGLSLEVESTGAEGSHSLTVRSDTGIDGVRYTTGDPEQPLKDWTPINKTTGIPRFEADTTVYVRVIPTHGYTYGVEQRYADDAEATEATKVEGKEYYKFVMTSDLTLSIAATPEADTHKLIVKTNQREEYETIEDILYTIKNGNETVVEDETLYWDYELENGAYESAVIKNGETVTLKIMPYDNYVVEVTKNGESLTGENNIYDLGPITEDVTVMVKATLGRFWVYENIYGDPGYENCRIAYQNDCVKNEYIAKGTDLTFKVTSPANAKIRSVSYSSGYYDESGDEEDWHFVGNSGELTADADGIYTITADKIVGEVNINVWIHDSANNPGSVFVCWNDVTGLKQVDATYTNTAGEEKKTTLTLNSGIWEGGDVYAKEGTQLTFKLTPDTCYSIDKVTYDGKELSPDKDGTYKIEKIDGGYDDEYGMWRKIGVSAKVDPKKTFTFDYQLVGDECSVEAVVTVKEGTDVRDGFVLNKSQKITTIAGNTLNVTVRPKEGYKITEFDGNSVDAAQQTTAQTKNITYDASNKSYTLSVTTVPEASTGAKTVTFTVSENAVHITNYEVTKADGVTADSTVKDKYAIAEKAERLQFAITAKDDYKPVVTRTAANGETRTAVSPVGDPAVKNGDKVYSYTIPAGALAAAGDIQINEERDLEAAKCAKVRVYEESDWQEVVPKGTSYGVETWKTYRIIGYNQWYEGDDEDGAGFCDLGKAKVYLGNAKDPIRHGYENYPSYSESGLDCADYDGDLLLAIGQGAAGQKITVEIDAKTKITLQATPAVTEVSLKDTKAENKITQAPGTLQSYPLTIKDAKSTDALRVEVKNVKVTKGTTTTPSSNKYIDAEIVGSNLDISTEPFADGVTSVEATLTFINASKEDATRRTASVSKDQKEITLTIEAGEKALTPADKITLKKVNNTIYTGQRTVVAKVTFGKDTLNRGSDVEVYEIPKGFTIYVDGVKQTPDDRGCVRLDKSLDIEVGVDRGAAIGKQTIKVRTTYQMQKGENGEPYDPVQAMASILVTVVRGIESITATSTPQIYKKDAKTAGTAKITVEYNASDEFEYADAKSAAPKAKKVTYDICDTKEDVDAGVLGYNSKGQPMVTVKNGTVTVDKEYTVKADKSKNEFSVRVKAADYAGNETEDFVNFTVVGKPAELGEIVFVNGENKQVWDGASAKDFAINELDGVRAVVLKKTVKPAADKQYVDADFVGDTLYTMTPAKGNVYVDADGYIVVNKLAKNIVIKAATNDGGKQTAATSGKFTVTADKTVTLNDAKVECVADWGDVEPKYLDSTNTSDTFDNTPSAAVIHLNVTDKDKNVISRTRTSIFDLKLAVSGAKVVKKSAGTLALDIVMTKSPVKVTLSEGKNKKEYTLINPALDKNSDEFKALQKAPSVSLKKGLKLYAGVSGQTLSFTMKNAVKNARYVVVSAQDMEENTETLMDYFGMYDNATLNPNVTEFSYTCKDELPELKKGASIAFTFLDRDYNVLTQTTKALKIKTTALKKSFKLDAKYTLSEIDAASVPLTWGKSSGVKKNGVKFTALYNANNKGTVNRFKDGFELDAEHGVLKLRKNEETGDVVARTWLADKNAHKNDWTGFVEYTVTYEDGTHATFVTKITTALSKDEKTTAKKYAASAVNVLNSDNMQGVTYVTIGKLPAAVRGAYAKPDDTKNKGVKDAFSVSKVEGNAVTLTVKKPAGATATYKGDLYIIPEGSIYADEDFSQGNYDWTGKACKVALTVNVKAANTKNKIKVTTKSVSFLDTEPVKLSLDEVVGRYYYAEIPYTVNVAAEMVDKDITLENQNVAKGKTEDKTNHLELSDLVSDGGIVARKVNNKNALGLYINAENFQEIVDTVDQKWSGAVFSKVKVTVPYGDDKVPESFVLSITMPNPWASSTAEYLLGKALNIIREAINDDVKVKGIADIDYSVGSNRLTVVANDPDQSIAEALNTTTEEAIADALLADPELHDYVDKLEKIDASVEGDERGIKAEKEETGDDANKQMLKDLLHKYTDRLVKKLEGKDLPATWGSLEKVLDEKYEDQGGEFTLVIQATSNKGTITEESCKVKFLVDENQEGAVGGLDYAIRNAILRISNEAVVPGVAEISYDVSNNTVVIKGNDADQDIVASKNAGRDKTVQILLGELGGYMDDVSQIEFSHKNGNVEEYVRIVKKEGHEETESFITDLVDKWTNTLANELRDRKKPSTYGSLDGRTLDMEATFIGGNKKDYHITFQIVKD